MPIELAARVDGGSYNSKFTPDADDNMATIYTEVDSGTNITLTTTQMVGTGSGAWDVNGVVSDLKDFTVKDYFQCTFRTTALVANTAVIGINKAATLNIATSDNCSFFLSSGAINFYGPNNVASGKSYAIDTTYTFRWYLLTAGLVNTIEGGAFATETILGSQSPNSAVWDLSTLRFHCNLNSAGTTTTVDNAHTGTVPTNRLDGAGGGVWFNG